MVGCTLRRMGVYLVSVGAEDWFGEGEDGLGGLGSALNEELERRGLPPYESVPGQPLYGSREFVRGSGQVFEEKLIPPMDGFFGLCEARLSYEERELLGGWTVLVPFSLDGLIALPVESAYSDEAVVAGAPEVLAIAEKLATAVDLPTAAIPEMCDNLQLTEWYMDGPARALATTHPAPWSEDLDAAFYMALYLRAAQHSRRRACPMTYS